MKPRVIFWGLFLVLATGFVLHAAALSGRWSANRDNHTLAQLRLRFGGGNNWFRIKLSELPDLRKAWDSNELHVRFQLAREAGTILFTGTLEGDEGNGDFEFEPAADFASTMATLGYADLSEKEICQMTIVDVGTAYVMELQDAGYGGLSKDQLMEMRIFNVDSEFINGLRSRGYDNLSASQLVEMRIHGTDLEFIDEMKALGYGNQTPTRLVEFRIHGVSPKFIQSIQEAGYRNVNPTDLVAMRIHGVDAEFIREARGRKHDPSIREIINMRILGR